jgi:ABC-type multidrug transport system permease subunit
MADHHGEVEYATATGNDYPEHEATYEAFLHLTYTCVVNLISVMIGLALGGVLGHWVVGGLLIAVAAIAALQGLVFNSRSFSNVVLVVAFLAFAFYGLG